MEMDAMTLREICDSLGVSRRAVQGYEKVGLVKPTGKNERGHLLYDEQTRERIREIRLFQQIGFTRKEVVEIIDAPSAVRKAALERQLVCLKAKKEDVEALIQEVYRLIEKS